MDSILTKRIEVQEKNIGALVQLLFSNDSIKRQEARRELVKIGKPAINFLVGLQYLSQKQVSWEAIKTLSEMAHPDCIPILINALENEDTNIRWLAAEGLIKVGRPSLMPVLEVLEERADSKLLRESVHHVLKGLKENGHFTDDHDLIKVLEDPSKHIVLAPTAAMIRMKM